MPDVYAIGMEFNLDDKASSGIRDITESLKKLIEQVEAAKHGFTTLSGALLAGAGVGIILGMTKMAQAANELGASLARLQMAGANTARALEAARGVANVRRGTTETENIQRLNLLRPFLGDRAEDQLLQWTMTDEVLQHLNDPGGMKGILEAAQVRGYTAPGRERQLDAFRERMVRLTQATGGQVTPEMYARAIGRTGRMSAEMENFIIPALLLGGPAAGRMGAAGALAALEGQALSAENFRGTARGRAGGIDQAAFQKYFGGTLSGELAAQFAEDPYAVSQRLYLKLQQQGLLRSSPEANQQFIHQMLGEIIKTPGTRNLVEQFMTSGEAAMGARSPFVGIHERLGAAVGTQKGTQIWDATTVAKMDEIGKAWERLMTTIAGKTEDRFKAWLDSIRDFIVSINDWIAKTPPETINKIATGIGLLAASLVVLGTGTVLSMFLGGMLSPFGLACAAIVGGIALLAGTDWKTVGLTLHSIADSVQNWIRRIFGLKTEAEQGPGTFANRWSGITEPWAVPGPLGGLLRFGQASGNMMGFGDLMPQQIRTGSLVSPSPGSLPSWFGPGQWQPGTPPPGQKSDLNLGVTLNLDGQTLTSQVLTIAMQSMQFPVGAALANGSSGWPGSTATHSP
jgi:hypothetical protein